MSEVTVYMFSSPTCAPCKHIKPALADLKEDYSNVNWINVNIQNDSEGYTEKYGVTVVPTMVVVGKNGSIHRHSGTNMMGYYNLLRNASRA